MQQPINKESKKPWYKKWWGLTLLVLSVLTLTFPVPLVIIMWQKNKLNLVGRLIITAIVGIVYIGAIATYNDPPPKRDNKTAEPKTSQQPAESVKQPTPKDPDTLNASASYNADGILFTNNEVKDFSSCTFTLNQDYKYMYGTAYSVRSTKNAALSFVDFTKDDGSRFNVYQVKPKYLSVWCHRKDGDSGKADIFWD